MEFKGTKGKWELKHSQSKNAFNVVGTKLGGRYKVARLPYEASFNMSKEFNEKAYYEQKANALLISKAPEMLEMLYNVREILVDVGRLQEAFNIDELIKQATEL